MNEWIPVKDGLPEPYTNVAVIAAGQWYKAWWTGGGWRVPIGTIESVTHWMPVPPLPSDPVREALRLTKKVLNCKRVYGVGFSWNEVPFAEVDALEKAIVRAEEELDKP